ncbi:MAG: hypothetical protein O2887_03500 [Bacteroidetes bacterium]|nr:hypothetical protein [Bacteroidota bacterium]MDA1119551.1 hypothetical protein [Bacteroidota bacterium]
MPCIFGCLVLVSTDLVAQSAFAPLNADYYHLLDRYEIKSGKFSNSFFSSFKPYRRDQIASFLDSRVSDTNRSQVDEFNIEYLNNDNWEFSNTDSNTSKKPLFGKLYRKKSDFINVNVKDFDLHLNPVIYWSIGQDSDSESRPFINTRGAQLRGRIDDKIAFYSFIGENQVVFPSYGQDYVSEFGAVPNEGFWKQYQKHGVDFFTVRGYIDLQATRHINLQFGHDKNFIGNGIRSMFLSDNSSNYFFLKLTTKVWRLNYTNLFVELVADAPFTPFGTLGGSLGTTRFPKNTWPYTT